MPASSGFSITIGAVDAASGKLDAVNKRLAALNAPAERFNKSLAKFGEVSGINRLSEGMSSFGNSALGAFRALEQMVSPMAAITSAASLGGIVALEKKWADAGNTIKKTAFALNMPVSKLSGLEGAFQMAGSSAEAAETTVKGLNETVHKAFYGDAGAQSNLNALGINWKDEKGNIADTHAAVGQLADYVERRKGDPHAQIAGITAIGGDPDALVALQNGKKGLDEWVEKANKTGGIWTDQMAVHAAKVEGSFSRLELNLKGVGLRIADNWSGVTDRVLTRISDWIEHNQTLSDSITLKVGGAITALGAIKPALWVLRLLGLDAAAVTAAPVVAAVAATALIAKAGSDAETPENRKALEDLRTSRGSGQMPEVNDGFGPDGRPLSPAAPLPTAAPPPARSVLDTSDLLGHLANSTLGKLLARGESGAASYNAVNRGAAGGYAAGMENLVNMTVGDVQAAQQAHKFNAAGRYQIIGPTLNEAVAALGLTGKEKFNAATQDRIFEQYLASSRRPDIANYVTGGSSDVKAAVLAMSKEWASVADPNTGNSHYGSVGNNKASITVAEAERALNEARASMARPVGGGPANGEVKVTITHQNPPPGTRIKVAASGVATAAPPRVETAMAHVG